MTDLSFSSHSVSRSAQRSIRERDIRLAVQYGYRHYEGTDVVCFLGNRWIPDWVDAKERARLNGTVVVLRDHTAITCFKNVDYHARLKKRPVRGRSQHRKWVLENLERPTDAAE
jgi:hypothetical protein